MIDVVCCVNKVTDCLCSVTGKKLVLKGGPLLGTQTVNGLLAIATKNCLSILKDASFVAVSLKRERQPSFLSLHA